MEKLFDPRILSDFALAPPRNRPVLVREMKRTICLRLFDSHLNFASWSMQRFFSFFLFFYRCRGCLLASKNFNFFDDIRVPSGPSRINSSSIILLYARKITKFFQVWQRQFLFPLRAVACTSQWLVLNSQSVYSNLLLFIFREKFKSAAITFSPFTDSLS